MFGARLFLAGVITVLSVAAQAREMPRRLPYPPAQSLIGLLIYEMKDKGQDTPNDVVNAYMWLNLSATQGLREQEEYSQAMAKDMTPDQIAAAQKLARDWRPIVERALSSSIASNIGPPTAPPSTEPTAAVRPVASEYVLIVHKTLRVKSALELDGASICVGNQAAERSLADYFHINHMKFKSVLFPEFAGIAYERLRCDAWIVDRDQATKYQGLLDIPADHIILPEIIDIEAYADQVWRTNSGKWSDPEFLEEFSRDFSTSSQAAEALSRLKAIKGGHSPASNAALAPISPLPQVAQSTAASPSKTGDNQSTITIILDVTTGQKHTFDCNVRGKMEFFDDDGGSSFDGKGGSRAVAECQFDSAKLDPAYRSAVPIKLKPPNQDAYMVECVGGPSKFGIFPDGRLRSCFTKPAIFTSFGGVEVRCDATAQFSKDGLLQNCIRPPGLKVRPVDPR